ncbi:hypothetical protein PHYPSEUDO_014663 [Phytophthora pseudosyringae]|uniref:Uncharacterized protein n=1 Tax=Phytophthora pseudosyringae TaxID=221518 RepID=A0A8T1W4U6_9STRA|nr:hypothetical protein PHYPSEUDO_014663 [Phytophthora pseudosyringae]
MLELIHALNFTTERSLDDVLNILACIAPDKGDPVKSNPHVVTAKNRLSCVDKLFDIKTLRGIPDWVDEECFSVLEVMKADLVVLHDRVTLYNYCTKMEQISIDTGRRTKILVSARTT